jgi:D-beta-D-heptose 7-phosphate kinase/D-beta-D-heptose 1-phosphate adenosyltransferase
MIETKIVSPARLQALLKKQRRKKVVFTNGCFDILHAGHVTYLEKAKKLGDILVIALNTDASTKRLKGPTRPVNPLKDRAKVIAALESVTYVTWFDEDTPLKLIQKTLPDILVKGGDYKPKDIVGYSEVVENGGQVKVISFLKGRSTTNILKRVADSD